VTHENETEKNRTVTVKKRIFFIAPPFKKKQHFKQCLNIINYRLFPESRSEKNLIGGTISPIRTFYLQDSIKSVYEKR